MRLCFAFSSLLMLFSPALLRAQEPTEPERDIAAGEVSQPRWPSEAVRARQAMVVTDERLASEAGVAILKQGGNAVDAAVAVAFALAVVLPAAGNIGGGGFLLVRMADGRAAFLDYRETAPHAATRGMYLRADGTLDADAAVTGYRSIAIPGTVAGLDLALRTYGTMKLAQVMAPAIALAEQGFPVSEKLARSFRAERHRLQRFSETRRIYLNNGALYQPGEIFRQPELAETLRRIARRGSAEFYRGETAQRLVEEVRRMGGLLTAEDLATYAPKFREPLRAKLQASGSEWEVITAPPPSSGGIAMISALEMLAPIELRNWQDAQSTHWVVEMMRRVFADRAAWLADSDFAPVPVGGLLDPGYTAERRATIDPQRASLSSVIGAGKPPARESRPSSQWVEREAARSGHTTHFSIVDTAGNAVANTYTLNDNYGSGVTVSGGFLLNDTMDDFTSQPGSANVLFELVQSDANAIEPSKRPVSSMTPTILLRDGKLSFLSGSPGGPRIISATLLTVLNWMRLGMDPQAAINAPRFHHQWMPDKLYVEEIMPDATVRALEARGHKIARRTWIGQVEAIAIDPKTGERLGAADPRREGVALGLP
jgi:gamma-glutamyltranspeptidase/glutathione hydrolase